MFQELLGKICADHLRTHIRDYLDEVASWTPDQTSTLIVPKRIDVAGQVGGVVGELDKALPAYALDVQTKEFAGNPDGLWLYSYVGHIAGMVTAGSEEEAGRQVKRHQAAVELFVRRHQFMHLESNDYFSIRLFAFLDSDFSGAEQVQVPPRDRTIWVDAFRIDFQLDVSEDGPDDHA